MAQSGGGRLRRGTSNVVVQTAAFPAVPFGEFRLLESIDRGSASELFRALWSRPGEADTVCALKRLAPDLDASTSFLAMFSEEAQVLAKLDHRNIVRALAHGVCDGVPWVAMEWLDGVDLARLIRVTRRHDWELPPDIVACLGQQIALGLAHAHAVHDELSHSGSLVHRDLRPANVVVLADGGVKLIEFGATKASSFVSLSITLSGIDRRKPVYLAPEQVRGAPADPRSDLFSLGVILWELLAGRPLFPPAPPREAARNVLEAAIPLPSSFGREVPAALEAVVMRLLAHDVRQRHASAGDAAADLAAQAPDLLDATRAVGLLVRGMIGTNTPTPTSIEPETSHPLTLPMPAVEAGKTDLELEPLGLRAGREIIAPPPVQAALVRRLKGLWKTITDARRP